MTTYEEVQRKLRAAAADDFDTAAFENLPPDYGTFADPPQPGPFRWKMPENLLPLWDVLEVKKYREDNTIELQLPTLPDGSANPEAGKPVILQRVQIIFDKDSPLTVVQSKSDKYNGDPFTTRISNVERWRPLPNSKTRVKVNDMIYLIRVFNPAAAPKNNQAFMDSLNAFGGREFGSDLEWSGFCNDAKEAYFQRPVMVGDKPHPTEVEYSHYTDPGSAEPRKGCGERIYMNKWPKDPATGLYAARAFCKCAAAIRPFPALRGFRA